MASPLNDAQRTNFEAYFKKGGGFVGIGSAVETDSSWTFLSNVLGTRSAGQAGSQSGTVKVFDRVHDASKNLPEYWDRTENWYNFSTNVRGTSHVLASVVEDPFSKQPAGNVLDGIAGGTMGANHPISFCKDYQGGRSFYTGLGTSEAAFNASLQTHLKGAIAWAAGQSNAATSDCGATVTKNFQQTKISAPPNLNEPIGFDQFPDGRVIQTSRRGDVRLHNPATGTTTVIADFGAATLPQRLRVYTNSEDGMYGPAVDNNFATNKWVYLYYSPQEVQDVLLSDGTRRTQVTPNTGVPASAPSKTAWDPYVGYFQLSRFKFVEDAQGARLDLDSEQQILRVTNNRQECCHVAGDIDFDKNNNLWLVTGDDTPAAGINGGGYGPFNDQLTDEQQVLRLTGATGGTYTLTWEGQTTAPIAFNATANDVDAALEALSNIEADEVQTSGGPASTANLNVFFRRAKAQKNQTQITINGAGLTGTTTPTVANTTQQEGGWYQRPTGDDRRSTLNTNDLRGKIVKIKVKDTITAADANKADYTGNGTGAYTIPAGNLYPLVGGAPQARTKAEVYAMGFRNPYRIQVDSNDVAYVTDYSPDANTPQRGRGPSGVGRMEIVRKPSNYGYPLCYTPTLGYWKWDFHEFAPGTTTAGFMGVNPEPYDCSKPLPNTSHWVRDGGPANEPGLAEVPAPAPVEIWYSYRDNNATAPLGTPCAEYAALTPGPIAPGSTTECARLFPELYTGGVAPHGVDVYEYSASNPNTKKFPAYYDKSIFMGEFGQDTMREIKLDAQNRVFKINNTLDCGAANVATSQFPFECDNPEDLQFGDDGALYLLTYGDGFFAINPDAGMYKWEYVKGTRAPKAVINTNKTDGALPLTVQFTGTNSSDEDPGDSIRYEWNFGDGTPLSEEANPTHVFTQAGRYTVSLKVTDSSGQSNSTSTVITAGNTSPTVTVTGPVDGGFFSFGDKLQYKVTVSDPEDKNFSCDKVTVTFVLGHDTHGHAEGSSTGCTGFLQTDPEDASHGGNVFGVVSASYTDEAQGNAPTLTTVNQIQIRQKRQEVEHVVSQSGTTTATNTDGTGGVHRNSLANTDWLQLNGPFNAQQIDTVSIRYADPAAGRTVGAPLAGIDIRQDSITGPIIATADLASTGGIAAWATTTVPLTNVQAGKHELFVTFRAITGGTTGGNLFSLNWLNFNGNGVTVVETSTPGSASGTVPATLSLSLGAPASFGAFTPGVAKTYTASTTANVISTAGDATLSVSDAGANPGKLVNGAFSLPKAVTVKAASAAGTAAPGGAISAAPTTVLTYGGPVTNDSATVTFSQEIAANDALRTGSYGKTFTFTLSTTTP